MSLLLSPHKPISQGLGVALSTGRTPLSPSHVHLEASSIDFHGICSQGVSRMATLVTSFTGWNLYRVGGVLAGKSPLIGLSLCRHVQGSRAFSRFRHTQVRAKFDSGAEKHLRSGAGNDRGWERMCNGSTWTCPIDIAGTILSWSVQVRSGLGREL